MRNDRPSFTLLLFHLPTQLLLPKEAGQLFWEFKLTDIIVGQCAMLERKG